MSEPANLPDIVLAVRQCQANKQAMAELQDLLKEAEGRINQKGRLCSACGNCCRFDIADHRLYVTTAELALLAGQTPTERNPLPLRCHYHKSSLCTSRDRRPLGCRTYFCADIERQERLDVHEHYHELIKRLHERHGLPYYYVEITNSLIRIFRTANYSHNDSKPNS